MVHHHSLFSFQEVLRDFSATVAEVSTSNLKDEYVDYVCL